MLAAVEELLDSWPGTLLVVSHDRYFIERVTDQQYAILGGRLRHLPGGVDEYLRLRAAQRDAAPTTKNAGSAASGSTAPSATPALAGADRRAAEKEVSAIERRLQRLQKDLDAMDVRLADAHDDYDALLALQAQRDAVTTEITTLEERWLELGEELDG
ncbi:MAG: hypothetical protein J0J05_15750 [Microbacterium sp.]|nr:hypothetical protein [Microbacterium sp.]